MRLITGIILLVVSTFLGFSYSGRYGERRKTFERLGSFNSRVKTEVVFSKGSLVSLVKNTDCDNPATEYIRDFFLEKKESEDKLKIFTKEEKDFFTDYVRRIGQGDKKSQMDYLEAAEAKINEYISAAEEADKKYRPLCIKLGFLFGLIILIILL